MWFGRDFRVPQVIIATAVLVIDLWIGHSGQFSFCLYFYYFLLSLLDLGARLLVLMGVCVQPYTWPYNNLSSTFNTTTYGYCISSSLCSACCTCGPWKSSTRPTFSYFEATTNVDIWLSTLPSNRNVCSLLFHSLSCHLHIFVLFISLIVSAISLKHIRMVNHNDLP